MDIELGETVDTTVDQWIVTGEPGEIQGAPVREDGTRMRYPSYRFIWSSADSRWLGPKAEREARRFIDRIREANHATLTGAWESGPFLHHRTVTYGPLEQIL